MSARARFIFSLVALLGVFSVGTAGYMMIETDPGGANLSFIDAAYMTVITLSTVGYGEVWPLSRAGRAWTIGVIAFGIVTVSYALTSLVTLVVSGEIRSLRERHKMEKTIDQLSDHIILCGYGRMGALIAADLLERNVRVAVVENEPKHEPELRKAGLAYIIGDATDESTLLRAGLLKARGLVITLPTDADNVFLTLTAHTLYPDLTIVARGEQPATEAKLLRAGASRVVCPQVIGARKIANLLTRPTVVDFVEVADKGVDLEIDEYSIAETSPLVGRSLRDSHVRRHTGAIVVAIKRADGQALVGPDPDALLEANDTLILVGPSGVSTRLDEIEAADGDA